MAHTYNSSPWETEAERLLIVQGQTGLQNENLSGREGEMEDILNVQKQQWLGCGSVD